MNAPSINLEVVARFQQLRRRYCASRIGIALAVTLSATALTWAFWAYCDFHWEWSLQRRRASCAAAVVAILGCLIGQLYFVHRAVKERRFASRLEDSFDGFGQRIRTVLDSVEGQLRGPEEMLAALGHQTLGRWEALRPAQLIPSRLLIATSLIGLLAGFLFAVAFLRGGDLRVAMLRAAGADLPYTTMSVTPGDMRVMEGTPIEVSLQLTGRTERDVIARYRYLPNESVETDSTSRDTIMANIVWSETPLNSERAGIADDESDIATVQPPRSKRFSIGLGNARDTVEYQFVTSVGATQIFRVDVQPLIKASRMEVRVVPPAYTRLASRSFSAPNVAVIEGSSVTVRIQTNHSLSQARLEIGAEKSSLGAQKLAASESPSDWTFDLPSNESIYWRFSGKGRDGTPMLPVTGRVRVRRDSAPRVVWKDPPDQMRVHSLAELPLRVDSSDDFGLSEAGIVFQLGGGDDEYVLSDWFEDSSQSSAETTAPTTKMKLDEILPLESFELTEREFVSYFAFAIDNRGPEPQRTESDIRYIDVRPLRQYFTESDAEVDDTPIDELLLQLDEIIGRQRYLINRTRRLRKSPDTDLTAQLGTIDQLVDVQSELARLSRLLAEFMFTQGNDDAEALNQAETSMLQAADSLSAASFDLAVAQQDDALRALAEARRTLENLIMTSTSAQQQSLRSFAKEMRQRLRPKRISTVESFTDSLERIMSEQMRLGQEALQLAEDAANDSMSSSAETSRSGGDETEKSDSGAVGESNEDSGAGANTNALGGGGQSGDQGMTNAEASEKMPAAEGQPGAEEEPSAQGQPSAQEQPSAEEQPSDEEQQERLYAEQVDLLKRLQAIQASVDDQLDDSALLARRFAEVEEAMDDLATRSRDLQFETIASDAESTVDLLREVTMHMEALEASEPVSRISAVRDMTTSLADMERQLANLRADDVTSERERQKTPSADPDRTEQTASENQLAEENRIAGQMNRRAETIEDVLRDSIANSEAESSDVADNLERFLDDAGLLEKLAETRDAAQQIADESSQGNSQSGASDDQMGRANEYGESVQMLDEMYRKLVAPRLTRLREIEAQASELSQQLAEEHESDGTDRTESELRADIRSLQQELEDAGLDEVSDLLSMRDVVDETADADETDPVNRSNRTTNSPLKSRPAPDMASRLPLVSEALRERIQEMILKEISVDRDTPVPIEYRGSVDGYFRALAGEAPATGVDRGSPGTSN